MFESSFDESIFSIIEDNYNYHEQNQIELYLFMQKWKKKSILLSLNMWRDMHIELGDCAIFVAGKKSVKKVCTFNGWNKCVRWPMCNFLLKQKSYFICFALLFTQFYEISLVKKDNRHSLSSSLVLFLIMKFFFGISRIWFLFSANRT